MIPMHFSTQNFSIQCNVDANADDPISKELRKGKEYLFNEALGYEKLFSSDTAFLDIGAHIGLFSLLFAAKGHDVYSIEASSKNAKILNASQSLNHFENMHIYNFAISDANGVLKFAQNGPWGCVEAVNTPKNLEYHEISKIALDTWEIAQKIPSRLAIKIDIEGHEIPALKGMKRFLQKRHLPPIFIESNGHCLHWNQETPSSLCHLLNSYGYDVYRVIGCCEAISPISPDDMQAIVVENWLCINPSAPGLNLPPVIAKKKQKELIRDVMNTVYDANPDQRAYTGRVLQYFPEFLGKKGVFSSIIALMEDPHEKIPDALKWVDCHSFKSRLSFYERTILKLNLWKYYHRLLKMFY